MVEGLPVRSRFIWVTTMIIIQLPDCNYTRVGDIVSESFLRSSHAQETNARTFAA